MAGDAAVRLISVGDFLSMEDKTDTRYELVDGRIVAMAPPSEAHGTIVANTIIALGKRLPRGCRAVSEAGIRPLSGADWNYWQADVIVTCTGRARDGEGLAAPVLIVEVLSPSTLEHDRGRKVPDYVKLPSVQEVLLIDSVERRVQLWSRVAEGWFVRDQVGSGELQLSCIQGAAVSLDELYEGV